MKIFFLKLLIYGIIVMTPYIYLQLKMMESNDAFYWKSVYRSNVLIIGGSRALKGISPSILKKELDLPGKPLNLAFTGVLSPYGSEYLALIKRKIDINPESGYFFILSVNPGNVMDFTDATTPRESEFRFYDLFMVNANPNIEYVIRHPRAGNCLLVELVEDARSTKPSRKVFTDGSTATFMKDGKRAHITKRKKLLKFELKRSHLREEYLNKTVNYLHNYGTVLLVRMPVSSQMLTEENDVFPEFNKLMHQIAGNYRNAYFIDNTMDYDVSYKFTDGNHHLEGESSFKYSKYLANQIKNLK